ncbi:MAG: hypothetical protein GC154_04000 [bacterium]|nr:hypothetical protein [bacterium]
MALDQVANNSLYRPVPSSTLQQNLARYYKRTAEFVNENFHELRNMASDRNPGATDQPQDPQQPAEVSSPFRERVRPVGLGGNLDIFV